jgi:hypothetical protein
MSLLGAAIMLIAMSQDNPGQQVGSVTVMITLLKKIVGLKDKAKLTEVFGKQTDNATASNAMLHL